MPSVPFLKEVADIILQKGEYNLTRTCIVFANKRARLFLSKYIGEFTDKPVWAPRYYTISELMEKMSGYYLADRLSLLFELYGAYSYITQSKENFDSFYSYSESLLADFDEIDKYLVNADDLFQNLSGLKSLDGKFNYLSDEQLEYIQRFWRTFQMDHTSHGQKVFITLWERLAAVYHEFRKRLGEKHLAYEGMAYRKAVENQENPEDLKTIDKFLFVGFNALNACEERLFRLFMNQGKAEFYWDYDEWYTNNEIHEAGYFIRKNIKNFPSTKPFKHDHLSKSKSNILYIPVTSNSGQASILPYIFNRMGINNDEKAENTALVLADEGLLISSLYAIPQFITGINVTMGYPMSGSAVYSLIDSLYELLKNARTEKENSRRWYYKDVLSIMSNPVLKNVYGKNIESIRQKVIDDHAIYLTVNDIVGDKTNDFIFQNGFYEEPCKYLSDIVSAVIRELPSGEHESGTDPVQLELLFQVYIYLTRLQDLLIEQNFSPGFEVMFRLIKKMLHGMHVPFSGEPLSGLQILGILETRTLDFENIILLSANEGILPKTSDGASFIPYNLRSGFGMPLPEHHDAIYAYYFYRLIQRAENIALVYDARSGGIQTGERSRFLHQLLYEMQLPVSEIVLESPIYQIPVKPIIIKKSDQIRLALRKYLGENGKFLSPSAINEFLNCSLRFYFHHIAGLPQPEEVEEEIDARMFGNILHHSLKIIYAELGDRLVTRERLEAVYNNEAGINIQLDKAFNEILFGNKNTEENRKPEGYNLIIRQILYIYIRQFIKAELELCPFTIVALEAKHFYAHPVVVDGVIERVKVGGIIDRIDRKEGVVRILDYKTGKVKDRFDDIRSLFFGENKQRNDAAFQVLLYAYVFQELNPDEKIMPGLYYIKKTYDAAFSESIFIGPKKQVLKNFDLVKEEFKEMLNLQLENLFNLKMPFTQTQNRLICRFCPYAMICRRDEEK